MKARTAGLWLLVLISLCFRVQSNCEQGCDLALASFYVWPDSNLILISDLFGKAGQDGLNEIISYNRDKIPTKDFIESTIRINIPFPCDICVNNQYLGHVFEYNVNSGDTYTTVVSNYSSLTTVQSLTESNPEYNPNNIPDDGKLNVTVNCSCGNSLISKAYGLFITYPLRSEDSLDKLAAEHNISADLIKSYNPNVNFSQGRGLVFIPGKGANSCSASLYVFSLINSNA